VPLGAGFGLGLKAAFEENWEGDVNLDELVTVEAAIVFTFSKVRLEDLLDSRTLTAEEET
jgi:hypothetical protein